MRENTIVLEGGLGNRMRVAASAYAMSREANIPLRVVWTAQWGMRCRFDELFEPVAVPGDTPFCLRDAEGWERAVLARPRLSNMYAPRVLQRLCFSKIILAPQVWHLNQEGFDYRDWMRRGGCMLAAYRDFCDWDAADLRLLFRPNATVQRLIDARCSSFTADTIGIHIRRTDHRQAIDESPLELFVDAIEREREASSCTTLRHGDTFRIYLATDDEATKDALRSRYGSSVIMSDAEATRESADGIRDALAEMFALSRTRRIYGSAGSTFSPIAAALGNVPITIVQRDGDGTIDLRCRNMCRT